MNLNFDTINKLIEEGYISKQKHPSEELYVLNYTQKTQYEQKWIPETLSCRGIVIDNKNNIVARGLSKFFNYSELDPNTIPHEDFEVQEKMDGSFIGIYWIKDIPYCYTRGSFISDQAQWGTEILHSKYWSEKHYKETLLNWKNKKITPCFELIHPFNKIVVNYYTVKDLFLLTLVDSKTGKDVIDKNHLFPEPQIYRGITDYSKIKEQIKDNEEGVVIRFKNGFRMKIKGDEYQRLHKLITGVSNLSIWECLKNGESIDKYIEDVPDEFYQYVKETKEQLENSFEVIRKEVVNIYLIIKSSLKTKPPILTIDGKRSYSPEVVEYRKEFSKLVYPKYKEYADILFLIRDGMAFSSAIYDRIKPKYSKPFSKEI